MKVSELIEELKEFDLNNEIRFVGMIESGRSLSWVEVEDCEIRKEDDVVVLKVYGDEDLDGGCE